MNALAQRALLHACQQMPPTRCQAPMRRKRRALYLYRSAMAYDAFVGAKPKMKAVSPAAKKAQCIQGYQPLTWLSKYFFIYYDSVAICNY
jgi:hypothetical protein